MTVLVEHLRLGRYADQRAEGIENVNEQEREDDNDEVYDADRAEVQVEALAEGQAELGEVGHAPAREQGVEACVRSRNVDAGHLADHAEDPGQQDAVQDSALHLACVEHSSEEQADERQQCADAGGVEVLREADDGDKRRGVNAQTGVLEADEGDEQADTDRNTLLERQRNGVEDGFADVGQREHDEDKALNEYRKQRDLPGVAVARDNGVGHEGVEAHAGGQCERQVRHERHAQRAEAGSQRGRQQDGGGVHTGRAEHARVDGEDVRHGHEGGDTGHDFGLYSGVVFR